MNEKQAAGKRLVQEALPYWRKKDREGLAGIIRDKWSPDCLSLLLDSNDHEVVETAAAGLGVTAGMDRCPALARLLHHPNGRIVAAAEEALWSIWFRAGGGLGQSVLHCIAQNIRSGRTENTVSMLNELIRSTPNYAEAYHQRSQAHYLAGDFPLALRDARRAFILNPSHFAALANEAHALAALGQWPEAMETYRRVLQLHPHLPGVRESLHHLRGQLATIGA